MINKIKKILTKLGIKGYCKNCGNALVFDDVLYYYNGSSRYICPLCDVSPVGRNG